MKRILLLSFYHPPDLCAGSFRCGALLDAMREKLPDDVFVDVLTTLPNRYSGFTPDAPADEQKERIRVRRFAIPSHKSGMAAQANSFRVYAQQVAKAVVGHRYDLVVGTSSRLMTASLAAALAAASRCPLYLDIRDIFADTIGDVLDGVRGQAAKVVFEQLERATMHSASVVNLVSEGFAPYFRERYPTLPLTFHTNGIDPLFRVDVDEQRTPNTPPLITYAGNIGEGQGLHHIVPPLARRLAGRARFRIIGAGGRLDALRQACSDADNVELLAPVDRETLVQLYQQSDVLLMHLNDHEAFHKVLPSKVFEYGALGKPILAGVGGFAARFVRDELDNAAVFAPNDPVAGAAAFDALHLRERRRDAFVDKHTRESIMGRMADDIFNVLHGEFP